MKFFESFFKDKSVEKFIQDNYLLTVDDQTLYSKLVDLPEVAFKRLISLMDIAKETRKEKALYLKEKENEKEDNEAQC